MARPARWKRSRTIDGVTEIAFHSWRYFFEFIHQKFLNYETYIYRGHRDSSWNLHTTLDREFQAMAVTPSTQTQKDHLERFKSATRGRRGISPSKLSADSEWWALGQHYGLNTPLLDWTESPFVALFFAFAHDVSPLTGQRTVIALSRSIIKKNQKAVSSQHTPEPAVELYSPHSD